MYSNEERMKAIKLYIEYNCFARAVIRELGIHPEIDWPYGTKNIRIEVR